MSKIIMCSRGITVKVMDNEEVIVEVDEVEITFKTKDDYIAFVEVLSLSSKVGISQRAVL